MNKFQHGATTVEFALTFLLLLTFVLGVTDFSRMLFTWNAATEATRLGARYAVVCDNNSAAAAGEVLTRMRSILPPIRAVDLAWEPAGCNPTTCTGVTVRITELDYQWVSPIAGAAAQLPVPMPAFSTYLPREVMRQDPNSESRICRLPT